MEPDPEPVEQARRLFSGRVEFLLSAPSLDHLPAGDFPEVAFAGALRNPHDGFASAAFSAGWRL